MKSKKEKRVRVGITILKDILDLTDDNIKNANCKSRSDLIERALEFYIGYVVSDKSAEFMSSTITQTVQGIISNTEKRLSTIGFKQVVAMIKMSKILALYLELDEEQEKKIYIEALNEAKKINGTIPII